MPMYDAGLILEGGGMRGLYTAGALDCFLDEGVSFRDIYGVSAGACHACSFLSGQRGRAAKAVLDFLRDPRYASFRSLIRTGDFFGVQMSYRDIPDKYLPYDYGAYRRTETRLHVAVTNLRTGMAEYKLVRDMREDIVYVQASSSLPLLSRAVEADGQIYLDGGVADSIPLQKSMEDGNRKNVVILTRHKGYRKTQDSMLPLLRAKYRRYPAFVKAMENRHLQYNRALALACEEEQQGRAVVIQPRETVQIGRLEKNREKLQALYRQGYRDAREQLAAIRRLLEA